VSDLNPASATDTLALLLSRPVPIAEAAELPTAGGVPAVPGLYVWWGQADAIPGIAGPTHPEGDVQLLYVGIARSGPASKSTLRSRVVGNHIRGTTGQSTLRRSLAALLSEREAWRSRWTTRPVLVPEDEARLSEWMADALRLTWAPHAAPWTVEAAVIEQLQPPLNQADNRAHPLYRHVKNARSRWRLTARETAQP
jgi:hypothetical protein